MNLGYGRQLQFCIAIGHAQVDQPTPQGNLVATAQAMHGALALSAVPHVPTRLMRLGAQPVGERPRWAGPGGRGMGVPSAPGRWTHRRVRVGGGRHHMEADGT